MPEKIIITCERPAQFYINLSRGRWCLIAIEFTVFVRCGFLGKFFVSGEMGENRQMDG